jgi:ubiquinone/menaquinone biosynthesis C-methylase UbiE
MTSGWRLDAAVAVAYERCLVPVIFAPWARRLVDRAGVGPDERVLDVACGTGAVARLAVERTGRAGTVAGVDASPQMIEVAGSVAAAVEWSCADAHDLPFPDRRFDVVLCQFGLMFFADPQAGLAEMARVLRPGGRVALAVWRPLDHNPGWRAFVDALDRYAGPEAAAVMRAPFRAWTADHLRDMVCGVGFADVRVALDVAMTRFPSPAELVRMQTVASPLAGPLGALDGAGRDRLVSGLTDRMAAYLDDDGVAFPAEAFLVTGRMAT